MIKIDNSYDVILTYSPIIEITGHLFECFDYYLFLRQYYKVGILLFGGLNEEKLKTVFNSKYNVDYGEIKQDVIIINSEDIGKKLINIGFGKNTVVLITDSNLSSFKRNNITLVTKKLLGFACEEPVYEGNEIYKNLILLQDFRIYSESKYFKSIDYVKKIPFQFYKKSIQPSEDIGLMYVTYVCRKVDRDVIIDYHKRSGCKKTILLVPYSIPEYDNIENVEQIVIPLEDMFDKFSTYIYTPVKRHFDCSPRLISECFLHNKRVFMDLDYEDIGLQTRYNDCINDINSIILRENDKILEIIDNVRGNN